MTGDVCSHEKDFGVIDVKLENMNSKINDIHQSLLGNGQPGLLNEFNQMKGSIKILRYIMGITIPILSLIITIIGIYK